VVQTAITGYRALLAHSAYFASSGPFSAVLLCSRRCGNHSKSTPAHPDRRIRRGHRAEAPPNLRNGLEPIRADLKPRIEILSSWQKSVCWHWPPCALSGSPAKGDRSSRRELGSSARTTCCTYSGLGQGLRVPKTRKMRSAGANIATTGPSGPSSKAPRCSQGMVSSCGRTTAEQ
jgi:hypothetical protein